MDRYVVKKGLVKGYNIGLKNDALYFPVADRDVISFKKFSGEIEAMLIDGTKIMINNWADRVTEKEFNDKSGRGKYKIGYFLYKPKTDL